MKRIWKDNEGNEYTDDEVLLVDIDTMGPQYAGWITKQSYESTSNMHNWIKVTLPDCTPYPDRKPDVIER